MAGMEDNDYFEVVRRPLDIPLGEWLYNATVRPSTPLQRFVSRIIPEAAHWHLRAPSGKNVGFSPGGYFDEDREYEPVPEYIGHKIPGEKVRKFVYHRQAPWDQAKDYFDLHPEIGLDGFDDFHDQYSLRKYNCKDFIKVFDDKDNQGKQLSLLDLFEMDGDS